MAESSKGYQPAQVMNTLEEVGTPHGSERLIAVGGTHMTRQEREKEGAFFINILIVSFRKLQNVTRPSPIGRMYIFEDYHLAAGC